MYIRSTVNMVSKVVLALVVPLLASPIYCMTPDAEKRIIELEKIPFDCPPNEKYYKCGLEVCYKKCAHLSNAPACPLLDMNCYEPSCECVSGYLRIDDGGRCIPIDECPTRVETKVTRSGAGHW